MRGNYRSENEVERPSGQLAPAKDGVGAGFANWRALGGQWGFVCREVQKQIPRSLLRRRSGQAHEGTRPHVGTARLLWTEGHIVTPSRRSVLSSCVRQPRRGCLGPREMTE